jgi:aminoglycoside phosphotransferase family enzyme/predicted kinase
VREVELNRRLAPDVYEGVGEIRGADGRTVEHLVLMRRMPENRRLASLVRGGAPLDHRLEDRLRAVARLVADFHTRCETGPIVSTQGTRDAVLRRWRNNIEESRVFRGRLLPGAAFDEVESMAERFLAGRTALFADRVARGAIVDGHGDLLADDIFCLPDGPRILDCLDFDDALRHLDRVDDVACLAMDLERLGSADAGALVLEHYLELSGDPAPVSLVDHYVAYRAFMRAKVTCLRADGQSNGSAEARRLLGIAHRHLRTSVVSLVLVGGGPGTGKTTTASALADALGAVHLSSDRVRKELAGLPPETPSTAAFGEGIYSESWTERTYEELLSRAAGLLAMGETVILDATWADARHRLTAGTVAQFSSSELVSFCCEAPADLTDARIAGRPPDASDADLEIAHRARDRFDPWPEATVVWTADPLKDNVGAMVRLIRSAGVRPG